MMGKDASGQRAVQIDERWLSEWFEKGFSDLVAYLARHAGFDHWCAEHHRDVEPA